MATDPPMRRDEPDWGSPAIALVNSEHWYGRGARGRIDQLAKPGWLEAFLARWELTPDRPPDDRDRRALVILRAQLRGLVTGFHQRRVDAAAVEALAAYVERGTFRKRLARGRAGPELELLPVRRSWDWVLGEIASSFVDLVRAEGEDRIKLCANDECGWAFYDESKNRRRRWCDMQICGNVAKVRRFRARSVEDKADA